MKKQQIWDYFEQENKYQDKDMWRKIEIQERINKEGLFNCTSNWLKEYIFGKNMEQEIEDFGCEKNKKCNNASQEFFMRCREWEISMGQPEDDFLNDKDRVEYVLCEFKLKGWRLIRVRQLLVDKAMFYNNSTLSKQDLGKGQFGVGTYPCQIYNEKMQISEDQNYRIRVSICSSMNQEYIEDYYEDLKLQDYLVYRYLSHNQFRLFVTDKKIDYNRESLRDVYFQFIEEEKLNEGEKWNYITALALIYEQK